MVAGPEPYTLPATYLQHLATLAQRWGVQSATLFRGTGLTPEEAADPARVVPVATVVAVGERARELTGEPGIGVYLGLQTYISAHGYLGFAAMSALTLRQALAIAAEFVPTRTGAFTFRLRIAGTTAAFEVIEHADFGSARDTVLMAVLIGFWQISKLLLAVDGRDSAIELAMPRPHYFDRFDSVGPVVRFERASNAIVFDVRRLDATLATADSGSFAFAREECARAMRLLESRTRVADRVRRLVVRRDGRPASLEEIARSLDVSARTLRRRLVEEGTSFGDVRDRELGERAKVLLQSGDVSIDEVARRLGYDHVGNFARAFRRWTGQTPTEYRKTIGRRLRSKSASGG
jgi:AraC-like DNA-binding protein